ncbi:MAG: iron ABC transporter permease [Angelakisella sp.]
MERNKITPAGWVGITAVCMVAAAVLSLCLGSVPIPLRQFFTVFQGDSSSASARILLYVRLPRTVAALFAGAGLAGAGVIIQSLLNNPLASPNIIGVNAGAGFFAVLCCALFPAVPQFVPFGAFLGALLAVLLVYAVAKRTGASRLTIVLAGVAVNSFLNAGTDTVHTFIPDALVGSNAFRIGGLSGLSVQTLRPACMMIALALVFAFLLRNELDILSLGDETAASLGLAVKRYRFLLLIAASCLAGASVSFAGLLGFVGLIVPHTARFLVGSEARWLLPLSALMGAALLTICDLLARLVFAPYELPVGILLSFLGAPFFIWLLLHQRGGRMHD